MAGASNAVGSCGVLNGVPRIPEPSRPSQSSSPNDHAGHTAGVSTSAALGLLRLTLDHDPLENADANLIVGCPHRWR